ncbi:tRNA dimethylallyltransferase [Halocaridina rubra]|uniref:tRNA dimethylallyltransferase n=1 Tax=Halocaridina rubra TaxID=373956 RepID=A0AAN8XHP5_HALRR
MLIFLFQVYRGLDIVTNKVTLEEKALAPHHLLDFLDPLSRYSVLDFRNAALPLLERLLSKGIMPVIVGGTNYYIESLLWNVLVETAPDKELEEQKLVYERDKEYYDVKGLGIDITTGTESAFKKNKKDNGFTCDANLPKKNKADGAKSDDSDHHMKNNSICVPGNDESDDSDKGEASEIKENVDEKSKRTAWQDCDIPTEDLYQRLLEVDPTSALQYHPNNRRKIIR